MTRDQRAIEILEQIELAYKNTGRLQAHAVIADKLAALEETVKRIEAASSHRCCKPVDLIGRVGH